MRGRDYLKVQMQPTIKMNSVAELNEFFKGKKILIVGDHPWKNHVVDFAEMLNKDGSIPKPEEKPNSDLRMSVITIYGTSLKLERKNVFIIEKKIHSPNK